MTLRIITTCSYCNSEYVRELDPSANQWPRPHPVPDDWRISPDGHLLVCPLCVEDEPAEEEWDQVDSNG